jgi:tight adherence protein B
MPTLPVLFTFALVFGIIFVLYFLAILKPEQDEQSSLRRRLKANLGSVKGAVAGLRRQESQMSAIPVVDQLLRGVGSISGPLQRRIDRSGLDLSVGMLILLCLVAGAMGYLIVLYGIRFQLAAIVVGVCCLYIPIWFVNLMVRRRVAKFEEQFPEAIDLIARALRAGHAFTTGLGMVADEVEEPVRTEFRLLHDRQNYGMPLPDALKSLAVRVPLLDARFFATAVLTQRESGGNLSEVLDGLSKLIRERFKLKRQVRTLSAHGRITGWVLAALPIALAGLMFVISPEHIGLLFTDPLGVRMIVAAGVLQVIGFIAMQRIVNIEI